MKKNLIIIFFAAVFIALFLYLFTGSPQQTETHIYNFDSADREITLTMYHGEGCQCCVRWAEYLQNNGVEVIDSLVADPHALKREKGVPGQLSSCHTAIVDGYVVEGHVPVEDIRRMLHEQPDAIGISVPGMPPNAPGMDFPHDRPYSVFIFTHEEMSVYNTHQ